MANPTLIKHRWKIANHFGRVPNEEGLYCISCGQFVPACELPYLKEIYEQTDCPKFMEVEGDFVIQFKEPHAFFWNDHTHCENMRQAIDMCRNQGDGFELRLLDVSDGSWIEI